jgi:hypothetical protein
MPDDAKPPFTFDEASYEDYARKMDQFVYGPTTTYLAQLNAAAVDVPAPESIPDQDMRKKLWEVLAALAALRVYLDQTDHLSDREVYAKLFHELLQQETPAIDEIGFNSHVPMLHLEDDQDLTLYLKHYADDEERSFWAKHLAPRPLPAHEDPPYDRDQLLPAGAGYGLPEAAHWLRANWSPSAFASNRFHTTTAALEFVQQLYDAGATFVAVDNVMLLPNHDWTPYADTLIVDLPDDSQTRRTLFELMADVGRPDEDGAGHFMDRGGSSARLWWD